MQTVNSDTFCEPVQGKLQKEFLLIIMCQIFGMSSLLLLAFGVLIPMVELRPSSEGELMTLGEADTAVVESTVREVRQAVPSHIGDLLQPDTKSAYLETFGDNDDEKGYHTTTKDKGKDGYKKREEYHKKDSDSYGFEKHTEFGKGEKGGKSSKQRSSKGTQGAPSHASYKVVENVDGDKKSAFEDYEGGHYADGYHDGESEGYTEYEGDSGHLESEGDGESGAYTAEESDGESEAYTADEEAEEEDY